MFFQILSADHALRAFSAMRPCFSAFLSWSLSSTKRGAVTTGTMIAKLPNPQRQFPTFKRNASAAFDPANAVIMYGDEVNANAMPRLRRDVTSAAKTATV